MTSSLPEKPPKSSTPAAIEPAEEFIALEEGEVERSDDPTPIHKPASPRSDAPPLPDEEPPPLPNEPTPAQQTDDDGWEPVWDETAQAFYFYNRITQGTQWENPRVPTATTTTQANNTTTTTNPIDTGPPGTQTTTTTLPNKPPPIAGSYDPAIHGDYDPTASYAQVHALPPSPSQTTPSTDPTAPYAATGAFNRFTGKWQAAEINPERFNDENKSKRQMNAYFDVDAAANTHDGRSLKAERSGKKLSKKELAAFKEKRREKKEEKRRAWLRD